MIPLSLTNLLMKLSENQHHQYEDLPKIVNISCLGEYLLQLGTDLLTVCETLNGLDEREWRQAMDEKIVVQKPCLGSCRTTAWQTSHRKYMGVQEENWLHQISGNTNIRSCHSIRIIAHLNGSSKWYCSAPDGCYHSIPEWNTNRGGVHDTTRRVHWEWKRIFCMQAEAEYNWLQKYLRC